MSARDVLVRFDRRGGERTFLVRALPPAIVVGVRHVVPEGATREQLVAVIGEAVLRAEETASRQFLAETPAGAPQEEKAAPGASESVLGGGLSEPTPEELPEPESEGEP